MWPSTPSADSLTRPRIAVAVVSVVAAASVGYYAYRAHQNESSRETPTGGGLHRSNAIRRPRRTTSIFQYGTPLDENTEGTNFRVPGDAETVVDVDVETSDDWWNEPPATTVPLSPRAGHTIVSLLFRVSEDNARRNGCVHRGCQCNSCGMVPIRGVRYRCANCADFDLCETCESQGVHNKTHIFYKIKVPAPPFGPRQMQPVWYTGDPDTCRRNIPKGLIARLSRDTGFERPELEAFWEQWTYMANTDWRDDPEELCVAMDRKTFERCLVPTGGSRHAAPNLIHDRMFSFYDSNKDGLIGFSEFLHGLSYRKRRDKLKRVFEGYDIDGDGYVNRRDFLRMFRAYYVLYKQMHKDILDGLDDQLLASTEAQQLVSSRQPLSSLFGREGRIPSADSGFRIEGKTNRRDGSIEVADGFSSVFTENRGDTAPREDILASLFAYDTDTRQTRRLVSRSDADTNWRTVRRRRDMARKHLHDRWKRRQFYLDEEEGGIAPDDWDAEEDILARVNLITEDSKARDPAPVTTRSRSSSKVRFAEDTDDYEIRSNPSTSSRSVPERWGGMDIPDAERDAGKEILYQVTQQAFNELLDTIFKKAEDMAVAAAESAKDREKYKAQIDAIDLPESQSQAPPNQPRPESQPTSKAISEKSLDELLDDTGYTVVPDEPRNAVDLDGSVEIIHEEQVDGTGSNTDDEPAEYRDPTLPQFRPNNIAEADELAARQGAPELAHVPRSSSHQAAQEEPDAATLRSWKRLTIAEAEAVKRGGWGRLSFEEFEDIYKGQEDLGYRLDYLGSWIDFCIP
ncbi:E3 ubiquitin-protein ligase HERC2 [Metarhizium anisopliae]